MPPPPHTMRPKTTALPLAYVAGCGATIYFVFEAAVAQGMRREVCSLCNITALMLAVYNILRESFRDPCTTTAAVHLSAHANRNARAA